MDPKENARARREGQDPPPEKVYDAFAADFDRTRQRFWKPLHEFLAAVDLTREIREGGVVLDAGCGNGRHMFHPAFEEKRVAVVGVDTSSKLLRVARERARSRRRAANLGGTRHFCIASLTHLPLREAEIDAGLAVAVLHHLTPHAARVRALEELARVSRGGGVIVGSVWRRWQARFTKTLQDDMLRRLTSPRAEAPGEFGDILVPWKRGDTTINHDRFYHLFTTQELLEHVRKVPDLSVTRTRLLGGPGGRDNVFFLLTNS